MSREIKGFFDHAKKVAGLAGDILKQYYDSCHGLNNTDSQSLGIQIKEDNDANLVTIVDKKIQDFIADYLKAEFPTHFFIGEESLERVELGNQPTWIIDPIDGTTNFVHGLPYCCVSIGLVIYKDPCIGVIYNPILGQMFSACQGIGAFLNDSRLGSSPKPIVQLSESIIGCEYGNERDESILNPKLEMFTKVVKAPVRAIRCFGSAAMNLCMVATGVLDVYFEAGIHCWDIAAGVVIVRESGGVVANFFSKSQDSIDLMDRTIVAVRPGKLKEAMNQRLEEIQTFLSPVPYDRD